METRGYDIFDGLELILECFYLIESEKVLPE